MSVITPVVKNALECSSCGKTKNHFMQAKAICPVCDELLLDLEIELEGQFEPTVPPTPRPVVQAESKKVIPMIKKQPNPMRTKKMRKEPEPVQPEMQEPRKKAA